MSKTEKILGVGVLIAIVIAIIGVYTPQGQKVVQSFGTYATNAQTNFDSLGTNFLSLGNGCQDGMAKCTQRQTVQRATFSTTVGTTTLCAIQNPFAATTTIEFASIDIQTATTAAFMLSFGTTTDQYTVGTGMVRGITGVAIASSTQSPATVTYFPVSEGGVVGPSQWVGFGILTSSTGVNSSQYFRNMVTGSATTTPAGACNVSFTTVN